MRLPNFFVTGTGTDVGKTFVSAQLLLAAQQRNLELHYWKPVQTGGDRVDEDQVATWFPHFQAAKLPCLSYPLPASPDQAARAAHLPAPEVSQLWRSFQDYASPLLIEGAGGLLVPLNDEGETWRDFLERAQLPVLLVAKSGLGTLNHTLLSLEALELSGLRVLGVILSGVVHKENLASLRRMAPKHRFHALAEQESCSQEQWQEEISKLFDFLLTSLPSESDTDWLDADRNHCWHPYTQHQTSQEPLAITRAKGLYLYDNLGHQLLDASSSWWTNSIGHGHPRIGAAIARQHKQIDHCIFAGATHKPASLLAKELVEWTGGHLPRVFYSDNGSCAVEIALKMAIQSWVNQGQNKRKKFLFFRGAYHGDTFGAMAVAQTEGFHKAFSPFLFQSPHLHPVTQHPSPLCPEGELALALGLAKMEALFAEQGQELAGVILEPWIQGASGMNVQSLPWLYRLQELCQAYQVPLILDEVFTGMGRLGSTTAFQRLGLKPDIVCLAKGLTGGAMPLAVTMASQRIFDSFLSDDKSKALLHGHTFTGHALACAAARETLAIYRDEQIIPRVLEQEAILQDWVKIRAPEFNLQSPRALGAVLAAEIPGTGVNDYFHPLAEQIPVLARQQGLMLRTLGNTLYLVPPLIIKPQEVRHCLAALEKVLLQIS